MTKVIELNEVHFENLIFKILNGDKSKKALSPTEEFNQLIEFHIKYHKAVYNLRGNYSEFKKNKINYLNNLFPNNHKIIKEGLLKFPNNIINESRIGSQIDQFFAFIKKRFINETIIKEQTKNDTSITRDLNELDLKSVSPSLGKLYDKGMNYAEKNKAAYIKKREAETGLTWAQIQAAEAKINAEAKKKAQTIYNELKKSFDLDGDGVLDDWDGTDEGGALKAIKKIDSRETLDALNRILYSGKYYKNLRDWVNAEMSDFDSEYGSIWTKLEKMGYKGANRNTLLKYAGATGIGQTIKLADKGIDWLRKNGIGGFMEGLREALYSAGGIAVQIFLDSFGVGAIAVAIVWGIMTVYDAIMVPKNDWTPLILSALGLLTAGAMGPVLAPIWKLLGFAKGGITAIISKIMSSKFGATIGKWIKPIMSGIPKIAGWIEKGVEWLLRDFSIILPANWVSAIKGGVQKAIAWVKDIANKIYTLATKESSNTIVTKTIDKGLKSNVIQNIRYELVELGFDGLERMIANPKWQTFLGKLDAPTAKLVDEYIYKNAKAYGWDKTLAGICKYFGSTACTVATKAGIATQLKSKVDKIRSKSKSPSDLIKSTKTKTELANLTKDQLSQYKKDIAKQTQKTIKDVQKVVTKDVPKAVDKAEDLAIGNAV